MTDWSSDAAAFADGFAADDMGAAEALPAKANAQTAAAVAIIPFVIFIEILSLLACEYLLRTYAAVTPRDGMSSDCANDMNWREK